MWESLRLDYEEFLSRVEENLTKSGWMEVDRIVQTADLVMENKPGILDRSKVFIAFFKGEDIQRKRLRDTLNFFLQKLEAVSAPSIAVPPILSVLGPKIGIAVFVFDDIEGCEYIVDQSRVGDTLRQIYVLGWIVDLSKGSLVKHKGFPIVKWGEKEILEALANSI